MPSLCSPRVAEIDQQRHAVFYYMSSPGLRVALFPVDKHDVYIPNFQHRTLVGFSELYWVTLLLSGHRSDVYSRVREVSLPEIITSEVEKPYPTQC